MANRSPINLGVDDLPGGTGPRKVVTTDNLAFPAAGGAPPSPVSGAEMTGYKDTAPLIGADNVQDAITALKGGGGGGFTPPDEFWVDQNGAAGTYLTIGDAMADVVNPGSILHLHGAQTHLWGPDASTLLSALIGTYATGSFTVVTAPLAAGDVVIVVTGVAGPRTPGSDNFDVTLGTPALLAAEIAAALNDPLNTATGFSYLAVGATITMTALAPGPSGNGFLIAGNILTVPPGGVVAITAETSGGVNARLDFLSYNGAATLTNAAGGDFTTDAILGFDGIDLLIADAYIGCVATFTNCTGSFGSALLMNYLQATPATNPPTLTFNDCNLPENYYYCDVGSNNSAVVWNRCTVGKTDGARFVHDPTEVDSSWTFNDCIFRPTIAGGIPVFETTQTDAEVSEMRVVFNNTPITYAGTGNAVMGALSTATNVSYYDSPVINDATTSTLVWNRSGQGLGSTILRVGDVQIDGFGFPLPPYSDVVDHAVTPYGDAYFDSNASCTGGAWALPGRVYPMRAYTTAAAPTMALTSLLDQQPVVPSDSNAFIMHIAGEIVVMHTSPFGGGAHFYVEATLTISGGVYTLVAGDVGVPDYDTSGGQYRCFISSVNGEGVQFLCDQGTYGNNSTWNATFRVVN